MPRASHALLVLSACLMALLLRNSGPLPIDGDTGPALGDGRYDVQQVTSPSAHGTLLELLSWVMGRSLLGPMVIRELLNNNQLHVLRALASKAAAAGSMRLYDPMVRLPREQYQRHADAADGNETSAKAVLQAGPSTPRELTSYATIEDYAEAFSSGAAKPSEVVSKAYAALDGPLAHLNIFAETQREAAYAAARDSDERHASGTPLSVLDGVAVAVKDMIAVKGYSMEDGSSYPSRPPSDHDDEIVARMRALGVVILGTTNMVEYGVSPLGWNARHQSSPNPHNESHYSGGSSSGSAVAVATGLVPLAIGFDGGGSIRVPASMSGVVGLAATFGRLPYSSPFASICVHGGPMTTTARDAAIGYAAIAGSVAGHSYYNLYGPPGPPAVHLDGFAEVADLQDVKLGVFWDHFNDASSEVSERCREAVASLEARGATVIDVSIPHLHWQRLAHSITIAAEFSSGHDEEYSTDHPFEPTTLIQLALGRQMTAVEVNAAGVIRHWAMNYTQTMFAEHQLTAYVTPTIPTTAPRLPSEAKAKGISDTTLVVRMLTHIFLSNFLGYPAASVPVGVGEGDLPIGLHFMAAHWEDAQLLRLAASLEQDPRYRAQPPSQNHVNLLNDA